MRNSLDEQSLQWKVSNIRLKGQDATVGLSSLIRTKSPTVRCSTYLVVEDDAPCAVLSRSRSCSRIHLSQFCWMIWNRYKCIIIRQKMRRSWGKRGFRITVTDWTSTWESNVDDSSKAKEEFPRNLSFWNLTDLMPAFHKVWRCWWYRMPL